MRQILPEYVEVQTGGTETFRIYPRETIGERHE